MRVKGDVKVDWYKGDELLEDAGHIVIVDEEDGETFTLGLEEASVQDSGIYKCVATNQAGTITSSATLTVVGPSGEKLTPSKQPLVEATTGDLTTDVSSQEDSFPYFEEPQQDIVYDVSEGDTVSFILNVHGKPKPEVEWFKDDDKLSNGGNCLITQDDGKHELKLQNMAIEDSGIYKCVASNEEGMDERTFKLDVDGKASNLMKNCFSLFQVVQTHTIAVNGRIPHTLHSQKRHRLDASCGFYRPDAICQQVVSSLLTSSL